MKKKKREKNLNGVRDSQRAADTRKDHIDPNR